MNRRIFLAMSAALALPASAAPAPAARDPFIGKPNAPVTMTLWFDFQCPYCKLIWRDTVPLLNDRYVRTGKLKLVFCDFSFLGNDSATAAVIGRAVWSLYPKAYFDWTTAMFEAQDGENSGFGDGPSVLKLTQATPGIDGAKFMAAFQPRVDDYLGEVREDYDSAHRAGIKGTPAMKIGDWMEEGAVPYDDIAARIDAALAARRR